MNRYQGQNIFEPDPELPFGLGKGLRTLAMYMIVMALTCALTVIVGALMYGFSRVPC